MTRWFLDASVLLAAHDPRDRHQAGAQRLLADEATLLTLDFAYYETTNVAARGWRDEAAASRLRHLIEAIADDGGLVRVDSALAAHMAELTAEHGLSAYDAGYVAGAARSGATLVSCDERDLVGPGLAITPEQALET